MIMASFSAAPAAAAAPTPAAAPAQAPVMVPVVVTIATAVGVDVDAVRTLQDGGIPTQPATTGGGYLWAKNGFMKCCGILEQGIYCCLAPISDEDSPMTKVILIVNKKGQGIALFKRYWQLEEKENSLYMYVDSNGLSDDEKKPYKCEQEKLTGKGYPVIVTSKGELNTKFADNLVEWFEGEL